jgi:hypothetical protein
VGFQPAHPGGFCGVIAYELEPVASEPPPGAPWQWTIEVESMAGSRTAAALQGAPTIHAGRAECVRVSTALCHSHDDKRQRSVRNEIGHDDPGLALRVYRQAMRNHEARMRRCVLVEGTDPAPTRRQRLLSVAANGCD